MPIDPRIIAGVNPAPTFDPLAALKVQNDILDTKMKRDELRQRFADEQQARQDMMAARQALTDANGDPEAAIPLLLKQGLVGPATALQEQVNKNKKAKADADKAQIDTALAHTKFMSQLLQGANEKTYPLVRQFAGASFGQDVAAQLPEQYDKDAIDALVASGMSASEMLQSKRDALEAPIKQVDLEQKQRVLAGTSPTGMTAEQQSQEKDRAAGRAQQAAHLAQTASYQKGELALGAARLAFDKDKAAKEAAAGGVGVKLPASTAQQVAGVEQSVSVLQDLKKLKNDAWLGPIAGRVTNFEMKMPGASVAPDLARFSAQTATLKNAVVKSITGAQMSEPEAKRIMQQIPDITDKPEVWTAKAAATEENLTLLRKRLIELSGGVASDLPSGPSSSASGQSFKRGKYTVTIEP